MSAEVPGSGLMLTLVMLGAVFPMVSPPLTGAPISLLSSGVTVHSTTSKRLNGPLRSAALPEMFPLTVQE